ncbi:MAG: hypothetical protein VX640_13255 [Pseudomonadota bacterium]|nr:hypothetical protein [Pseudomonadota bacterium]
MTKRHHWASRGVKAALLAGAACIVASTAMAQTAEPTAPLRLRSDYFGWGASVSPRVGYTDNLNLAPDGLEEDSFIFSNLFSGGAIISKPRFTGIVSGDLDLSFLEQGSDFVVNQNIAAASTATVVENLLYFDLAGSTSRQLVGENARFSSNINAARSQRADVHSYSASPYFYREFSDNSAAELRYRFSQVFVGDRNAGANPFAGGLLNDSTTHEAVAAYDTGSRFGRLNLLLTAYGNRTVEDGSAFAPDFEYEQGSFTSAVRFALTDNFALSGAVGYDEVNTDAVPGLYDDDALSGVFWRAGFTAKPGRKTSIRLEYGERYDDDFIDASVSYEISSRFRFTAGAGRSFETRAQSISGQFRALQRDTLDFADRLRDGAELSADSIVNVANRVARGSTRSQSVGIGVSNHAFASLVGAFDRFEVSARGSYENTDFGYRQNEIYTLSLDARRQISRRITAYGGAYYRHSDTTVDQAICQASPFIFGFDVSDPLFDPVAACLGFALQNGRTDTVGGRVGASYRLYENVSAFGEFSHATRFAETPTLEYGENNVLVGLTIDF